VRASSYVQGIILCFGWIIGRRVSVFMSVLTYVMLYKSVTPEKVIFSREIWNSARTCTVLKMTDFWLHDAISQKAVIFILAAMRT
jgi:hypothetical protein